jgi:hypothetical protein
MLNDNWVKLCLAQRIQVLQGEITERADRFGAVLARDDKCVYPLGFFEICGGVTIYPPQTVNPREEDMMLAAAMGLARLWDETGVLTLRFAKQRDGSDFALYGADGEMSAEARHLLELRGLWDGSGASFLKPGGTVPELLELPVIGISAGDSLYKADSLREALMSLPENISLTGWYERFLTHAG